jgi:hypothetical protein
VLGDFSSSFAMFAAIRRASSRVSRYGADNTKCLLMTLSGHQCFLKLLPCKLTPVWIAEMSAFAPLLD